MSKEISSGFREAFQGSFVWEICSAICVLPSEIKWFSGSVKDYKTFSRAEQGSKYKVEYWKTFWKEVSSEKVIILVFIFGIACLLLLLLLAWNFWKLVFTGHANFWNGLWWFLGSVILFAVAHHGVQNFYGPMKAADAAAYKAWLTAVGREDLIEEEPAPETAESKEAETAK